MRVGTNPITIPKIQRKAATIHRPTPVLCNTAWKKLCFSFGFSCCFSHFSSNFLYKPSEERDFEHFPRSSWTRDRFPPVLINLEMNVTLNIQRKSYNPTSSTKRGWHCLHSYSHYLPIHNMPAMTPYDWGDFLLHLFVFLHCNLLHLDLLRRRWCIILRAHYEVEKTMTKTQKGVSLIV